MNAIIQLFSKFFMSKDGVVAVAAIILLGVVTHFNTANPWINLLARVGNLAIVVYIIYRAAGKQIAAFFNGRRGAIAEELDRLSRQKDEAEQHLAQIQERIASLETECEVILQESRKQGEALKQTILAKAEADAAAIRMQATRAAGSEAKTVLASLRMELAEEIAVAVTKGLSTRLSDKDHARLIDNSLKKVVLH